MIRATPFHARTAALNRANLWTPRNNFTLGARYDDYATEACAARTSVVMADIGWRWRVMLEGARVRELAQRLFTRDVASLPPGHAIKALWLDDAGHVRGAGAVARHGRQSFQLVSATDDAGWIASAAALFGVEMRDVTETECGLAVIGPFAARLLAALNIEPALEPLAFRKLFWRSLDITLSRFGEHGGYEIWCKADDAPFLWDRVAYAGETVGIVPAGLDAMDVLDLEAGVPRPERDYAAGPGALAGELRLASLIDHDAPGFNGRKAALAQRPRRKLVGLALDAGHPAPFAPVYFGPIQVGRTLGSAYSPILRRAIALAQIDLAQAAAGTRLTLRLPPSRDALLPILAAARVADLPFLPPPDPIPA